MLDLLSRGRPAIGLACTAPAFLLLAVLTGCEKKVEALKEPPRLVNAVKLEAAGALIEGEFPGRAEAAREVELSFRVTGRLIELPTKVGDAVRGGQTIAQLDRRDFDVAITAIEGQLAKATADVEVAQSDLDRGLNIQKENPGAISQAVIEQRQGALKQAKANVVSTQARLEDAKNALNDTALQAPFDAVVVERYVENFEEVQAKRPVLRLVDASKVKMTFQLPEQHINRLAQVESFTCRFDALPGVGVPAQVHEVGTEALSSTRTYPVTLIMDQPEGAPVLPGMSGKVKVRLKSGAMETASSMVVPTGAVFVDTADQKFVWVVDPESKRVKKQPVKVGPVVRQGLLVEGLTPGTWIVTAGVHFLQDNQEVRLPEAAKGVS
jgi:RND family efflux transporter MFP subunit